MPIKQFLKSKNTWFEKFVLFSKNKKAEFIKKKINFKKLEKKIDLKFSNKQNFIEYSPLGFKYLKDICKIIKNSNGGLLIIDYGYFDKKMKNTLQAIYKQKHSKVLENIGKSDITYNINFYFIKKIIRNFEELNTNFTSQKNFLTNLGINQRAELISKNKSFSEKTDIFYRLKRLVDKKQMGDLFKVMLIKKANNNFRIGF